MAPNGICPECGMLSSQRHGWRRRRIEDFPAQGQAVWVELSVCRWRCLNTDCSRRTFSDHDTAVAAPYARRTSRQAQLLGHMAHAAGGSPAERLLRRLGIRVSDDTILRQLLRAAQVAPPRARIIGIDDWSWRKSQTYGTIIIDLERRAVIDVLEDRDIVTCIDWLKRHPEVEVISRDRCGIYAQAARQGAPQAEQVADRFHIVQNLRMAIEEQMNLHGRPTGRALLSEADNISTAKNLLKSRLAHRKSREEIFKTIWALREQGLTCSEIGRRTGFPRRSVAKWLQFETPPDRKRAVLKRSSAWYFEEYLKQSWENGIRSGNALLPLIRERGYEGSLSNLQRLLAGWRRAEKQEQGGAINEYQILEPVRDPETGHAISPVIAAALCIKPRGKLTLEQVRKVEALKAGSKAFTTMRHLAMRFNGILRGRKADPLPAWIDDAIETDLAPIVRFARTLNRDIDAVRNAIEMHWSNGQAEGQINRLKTLKRAMYGRAGPNLLRARMLPLHHTY
nr:ISL3 family transposase [Paracoccus homiensis]